MWLFWLLLALAVVTIALLPIHRHSRPWGYYPSSVVGVVLLSLLVLAWFGIITLAWPWHVPPRPMEPMLPR